MERGSKGAGKIEKSSKALLEGKERDGNTKGKGERVIWMKIKTQRKMLIWSSPPEEKASKEFVKE